MRKILFVSLLLSALAIAAAQVNSTSGLPNGDAHYNHAYAELAFNLEMPGDVSFQLPQVQFDVDLSEVGPGVDVVVWVAIKNTSNRAITVEDTVLSTDDFGLIPGAAINIAEDSTGWFEYKISTPADAALFHAIVQAIRNGDANIEGVRKYNPDTGIFTFWTTLVATGQFSSATPVEPVFGF